MLSRAWKAVSYNFAVEKKLFVYDSTDYNANSGIRATIFGPSGTTAKT
jgi:hypothetical protein